MQKVVVQILRSPAGGIRKHVFDILEYLSAQGFKQILITNTCDADCHLPTLSNLEIYHVDINDKPEFGDIANFFQIYKKLKETEISVVHGHGAKGGMYARALSLFLNVKVVYTPHGGSLHKAYGGLKNRFYALVERLLVPFTDVFLFESKYSSNQFQRNVCKVDKKALVNYNGVVIPNKRAIHFYQKGEALKLASFGLYRHLKGHDIAIETCALLEKLNIPFEYTIYGQGENKDTLISLIKKHGLEGKVFLREYSQSVEEEMLKYNFIWHPSRFESFGYVAVEAMSVYTPVIVSACGGLSEIVDSDCGFISNENTPESYLEIFKRIYLGQGDLHKKVEKGFSKVTQLFSKEKMLSVIKDLYIQLAKDR